MTKRQTNTNGMKAIIKHNVFKKLSQVTRKTKNDINSLFDSLTVKELKQKGLTQQIADQYAHKRNVLRGGMKRGREEDDEPQVSYKRTL